MRKTTLNEKAWDHVSFNLTVLQWNVGMEEKEKSRIREMNNIRRMVEWKELRKWEKRIRDLCSVR